MVCMVLIAMNISFNYALRMFWYPCNLFDIWISLLGLYMPELAVLLFICPSEFLDGGIKDPSMYMHCCGGYSKGCYRWYLSGRGIIAMVFVVKILFLGAFFHAFEILMW